jgi:carbohydrate kinase (thermoresistant glucokinase family)
MQANDEAFVLYIMGVSGSGKSTIGHALAQQTGIHFFDGDDFHPPENIDKMKAGHSLNDDDRYGWLAAIHGFVQERLNLNRSSIFACSALKRKYRIQLSKGVPPSQIKWIYLKGDYDTIFRRMQSRTDHFMPATLLQSQFDTLEVPENAIIVDINWSVEEIIQYILDML